MNKDWTEQYIIIGLLHNTVNCFMNIQNSMYYLTSHLMRLRCLFIKTHIVKYANRSDSNIIGLIPAENEWKLREIIWKVIERVCGVFASWYTWENLLFTMKGIRFSSLMLQYSIHYLHYSTYIAMFKCSSSLLLRHVHAYERTNSCEHVSFIVITFLYFIFSIIPVNAHIHTHTHIYGSL